VVVQAAPVGVEVTEYDTIAAPPSVVGGDHDNVAWAFPPVVRRFVGAPGTVAGVTLQSPSLPSPPPVSALMAKV